ncbi:DUF29 family protein [Trichormus azollae]|uniref:DUF29 family protein n=1 Tax=Trichormus azollae TaxID=1164 RepID=UPI00325D796F
MKIVIDTKELYESNYLQWLEETIKSLKSPQLEDIDYDNLIEELDALAKSEQIFRSNFLERKKTSNNFIRTD